MELTNSGAGVSLPAIWLWMLLQGLLVAGRDARPTIVNISPYLKTPHFPGDPPGRPYNNGYTHGVMVLCRADTQVRTYYCEHITLSQKPRAHYRSSIFLACLFTPIHHRRCRATHASHRTDSKYNGISIILYY